MTTVHTAVPPVHWLGLQERQVQKIRSERRRVVGNMPEAYIAVRYPVRLHGVSPLALRSDIQHLLRDCKARMENIRRAHTYIELMHPAQDCVPPIHTFGLPEVIMNLVRWQP